MKRMNGPMSFSATQEIGVLVEGFDYPPSVEMGHSRDYQGALAEKCGLAKEKDLFCWRYADGVNFNARTLKAWETVRALPEVKLRSVDIGRLREELGVIMEIYNETWAGKWGFVPPPARARQVRQRSLARARPVLAFIRRRRRKPAGMCIMVPNPERGEPTSVASCFPQLGGCSGAPRLKRPKSTRLILLGVWPRRARTSSDTARSRPRDGRGRQARDRTGLHPRRAHWTREDDAPITSSFESGARRSTKSTAYTRSRSKEKSDESATRGNANRVLTLASAMRLS